MPEIRIFVAEVPPAEPQRKESPNEINRITMEQLLHYVWRHKIYPLQPLRTTAGLPVEVIDPGLPNRDAGPDTLR